MAEIIGIASGIAGLLTLAMKVTELSYGYVKDIRAADGSQKQYLRELSALTQLLHRSEEAVRSMEGQDAQLDPSSGLSQNALTDCFEQLQQLRSELEKPTSSLLWPLKEKALKKHVENLHRLRDVFSHFLTAQTLVAVSATNRGVTRLGHQHDQVVLLEWIGNPKDTSGSPPSPSPGTGDWFVESKPYQGWASGGGDSQLLWCHGPPGVGKSVLASVALQHISNGLQDGDQSLCVLHYFCEFANRKEQSKEDVWRSLLRQVITQGHIAVLQALLRYQETLAKGRSASAKELTDALFTACTVQPIVLVIDGPDEMKNPRDLKVILAPFVKANCKILVTSRDLPEIRSAIASAIVFEVEAHKADLSTYITNHFEENDLGDLFEKHPELHTQILEKANGIFMLAKLLVDRLLDLSTVKEMKQALKTYPNHLDQAFESSLDRINAQSKSHSALAHRILGWVSVAERKFHMSELLHGLAAEDENDMIDEESVPSPRMVLKVCGGLVVTNPLDESVSLVHATVYEWFRNRDASRFHQDLAKSCLQYLELRPFSKGPAKSVEDMDQRIAKVPFLSYAARYWRNHVIDDEVMSKLSDAINALLDNKDLYSSAFQALNYKNQSTDLTVKSASFESMPTNHPALHVAAFWNLPHKVSSLIESGQDLNSLDSQSWTPLHWACFGESQSTIPVLLEHGANTELKDSVGWTPLFWATLQGNNSIVKLLLEKKADHLERDIHGWTPLRWAAARYRTEVIATLLRHHKTTSTGTLHTDNLDVKYLSIEEARRYFRDEDSDEKHLLSQLQGEAIDLGPEYGFVDLYRALIDKSFDLSILWTRGVFDAPVGNAWRTMTKLETFRGVDEYVSRRLKRSRTTDTWKSGLLHTAIRDNNLMAVKMLLELGANVNGDDDRTPLHTAAFRKDPSFAELLIEKGAKLEAFDHQGLTPLHQAVMNGFENTVALLLSKGANVNAMLVPDQKDNDEKRRYVREYEGGLRTPLMLACGIYPTSSEVIDASGILQLLLDKGADVNLRQADGEGMTALHYAAQSRNPKLLKMVIDAGADVHTLDEWGRTAVHHLVLGLHGCRHSKVNFNKDGSYPTSIPTECLTLLNDKCGTKFLSQTARWNEMYKTSQNCRSSMAAVHTPMSLAIVIGDWELFQGLYRLGTRFETSVPLKVALYEAFLLLQADAVDVIIKNGGVGFPQSGDGWHHRMEILSSDHTAAAEEIDRFRKVLAKLVQHGFDINTLCDSGQTLLHTAAGQSGSSTIVKALLELGADPTVQNNRGRDFFIHACENQRWDVLGCLLDHVKQHPLEGHWTAHLDYSKPAAPSDTCEMVCTALSNSGILKPSLEATTSQGAVDVDTLLSDVVTAGNTILFEQLVKRIPDANNVISKGGRRLLHDAAEKGHIDIVKTLINISVEIDVHDEDQYMPLHRAVLEDRTEVVDFLLANGASPHSATKDEWQPLHFAAYWGHTNIAQSLIKPSASVQGLTSHLCQEASYMRPSGLGFSARWIATALHCAAMSGNVDIVRLLLAQDGIDVDARTDRFEYKENWERPPTPGGGPTALHIVLNTNKFYGLKGNMLDKNRLEIATMLIEHGASVQGVGDHLRLKDLCKFKEFSDLWDKLRAGITEKTL